MNINSYEYDSPFGTMIISASEKGLRAVRFSKEKIDNKGNKENPIIKETVKQLGEYFQGTRKIFDLPLDLNGTDFQNKVWKALYDLPYGKLITYKELAESVACPKGYRAVGLANNRNPIPVICACHRVVGSNGSLTGYAYGLEMKKKLIDLENNIPL